MGDQEMICPVCHYNKTSAIRRTGPNGEMGGASYYEFRCKRNYCKKGWGMWLSAQQVSDLDLPTKMANQR